MPLPLPIRKEVRDQEPKKVEILAAITKTTGVTATYTFSMEDAYEKLDRYKDQIVGTSLEYLKGISENFADKFKDQAVKEAFIGAWKTKNIAMVILVEADYKTARAANEKSFDSYHGLRLSAAGDLEICTNPANFAVNTHTISQHNLLAIVPQEAGGLPLEHQKAYNDNKAAIDAELSKIKKLKGLEDATFEFNPVPIFEVLKNDFSTYPVSKYLEGLREQLEKQWKDDMVQEAILDEWKAPHKIRLLGEQDMKAVDEKKAVKDSYNGLRLAGGTIDILAGKGNWGCNTHYVCSRDLSTIL